MSFLNEATYNVKKGSTPPDPDTLEDDDVVNIEEKSPHNQGYGKDPKTGKIIRQNREDAIQQFLDKVKQSVEDEGDEWPTINEDLTHIFGKIGEEKVDPVVGVLSKATKFIKKAGGAQYKTPFTDLVDSFDELIKGKKDKNEQEKLSFQLNNIHKATQDQFDAFIKEMEKDPEADKDLIKKLIKKQKEYIAKQDDAKRNKEEEEYEKGAKEKDIKNETMNETVKEIVKKCLNRGMIKENISKVVKKYLAEVEGNLNQGDIVYLKSDYNRKAPFKVVGTRRMFGSDLPAYEVTPYPMGGFKVEYDETQLVK